MDPLDFSGQHVLVVGGSRGLGNGIAHGFTDAGAVVSVWGTKPDAANYDGVEGSDLTGLAYTCVDVSRPKDIQRTAAAMAAVDVLVLSQGVVVYGRGEFEQQGWDWVTAVNLDSLMHCATAFRTGLAEQRGSIIIISSVSGMQANKGNPAYAASKAGAISLTKTLGQAWAPEGVRVNGIAPGLVDTKLTKVTTEHPKRLEGALRAVPLGRMGTPSDMAGAALFLASPLAGYICGHTVVVDGGLTL